MDLFEKYLDNNLLSKENVLSLVDDYSIYCHYLDMDIELGTRYSSPLREGDDNPSFVFFESKTGDVLYKDFAEMGSVGGVFKFLMQYLGLSYNEVLNQINTDMELGLAGNKPVSAPKPVIQKRKRIVKEKTDIRIVSRDYHTDVFKEFWNALDISQQTLDLYNVHEVEIIHYVTSSATNYVVPKPLCIAYEIFGKYKIYQPFEKAYKFSNNFDPEFVEGALQLAFDQDFVIITKSMKEVMFFREHFGFEAVAGKSESSMITDWFMENQLLNRYKRVYIALDQDAPGRKAQAKYLAKYPQLIGVDFVSNFSCKDLTDEYLASTDKIATLKWIKTLFDNE